MDKPDGEAIFNEARRLEDPAERRKFLEAACGSDSELRERIESLLKAFFDHGSVLEPMGATGDSTIDMSTDAEIDSSIGPYKLLQVIGEGGMGVVYMAEQSEPIRRKVALKVIRHGMESREVVARFDAERQALALMSHPNIAQVLDAGTTVAGLPYFVMELIQGVPITEFCDQQQLPVVERLKLFQVVCQALQHAHQKGIIHRDLKPSNVLVAMYDSEIVPKVIDFGVAKAVGSQLTNKTMYTRFGQVVGTFEYMSPEQAQLNQLDVDTRSDIYSLGVLLYELLTGVAPFEREFLRSAAIDEIMRIIREDDPPRPSIRLSSSEHVAKVAGNRNTHSEKLARQVRGDLDWIVMKALEKDRGRRYATMNEFSDDLTRYIEDAPIQARPPSFGYRANKFVRKYKWHVGGSALLVASLLLGVIGTSLGMIVAWDARSTAEQRADDLETERDNSKRAWGLERQARIQADEAEELATQSEQQALQSAYESLQKSALSIATNVENIRFIREQLGMRERAFDEIRKVSKIRSDANDVFQQLDALDDAEINEHNAFWSEVTNRLVNEGLRWLIDTRIHPVREFNIPVDDLESIVSTGISPSGQRIALLYSIIDSDDQYSVDRYSIRVFSLDGLEIARTSFAPVISYVDETTLTIDNRGHVEATFFSRQEYRRVLWDGSSDQPEIIGIQSDPDRRNPTSTPQGAFAVSPNYEARVFSTRVTNFGEPDPSSLTLHVRRRGDEVWSQIHTSQPISDNRDDPWHRQRQSWHLTFGVNQDLLFFGRGNHLYCHNCKTGVTMNDGGVRMGAREQTLRLLTPYSGGFSTVLSSDYTRYDSEASWKYVVWEVREPVPGLRSSIATRPNLSTAAHEDGRAIFGTSQGSVESWRDGEREWEFGAANKNAEVASWGFDGDRLGSFFVSMQNVVWKDPGSGALVPHKFTSERVIKLSPDNAFAVAPKSDSEPEIYLWSTETRSMLVLLEGANKYSSYQFSRDSQYLIFERNNDKDLVVFNVRDREEVGTIQPPTANDNRKRDGSRDKLAVRFDESSNRVFVSKFANTVVYELPSLHQVGRHNGITLSGSPSPLNGTFARSSRWTRSSPRFAPVHNERFLIDLDEFVIVGDVEKNETFRIGETRWKNELEIHVHDEYPRLLIMGLLEGRWSGSPMPFKCELWDLESRTLLREFRSIPEDDKILSKFISAESIQFTTDLRSECWNWVDGEDETAQSLDVPLDWRTPSGQLQICQEGVALWHPRHSPYSVMLQDFPDVSEAILLRASRILDIRNGNVSISFENGGGPNPGVWDTETGDRLLTLEPNHLIVAVEGDHCLSLSPTTRSFSLWELRSGIELANFAPNWFEMFQHVPLSEWDFRLHSNGKQVAFERHGAYFIWSTDENQVIRSYSPKGHLSSVKSLVLDHRAELAISGDENGTVIAVDADTGNRVWCRSYHRDAVESLAVSPGNDVIVSGSKSGGLIAWSRSGDVKWYRVPRPESESIDEILFHASGNLLFVSIGNDLALVDASNGRIVGSLDLQGSFKLAIASDGKQLYGINQQGTYNIWTADASVTTFERVLSDPVASISYSQHHGSLLAAGRDTYVLDCTTGRPLITLPSGWAYDAFAFGESQIAILDANGKASVVDLGVLDDALHQMGLQLPSLEAPASSDNLTDQEWRAFAIQKSQANQLELLEAVAEADRYLAMENWNQLSRLMNSIRIQWLERDKLDWYFATSSFHLGDYDTAIAHLDHLIRRDWENVDARLLRAHCSLRQRSLARTGSAASDLFWVFHREPDNIEALREYGLICLELDDNAAAIDALERVVALAPDDRVAWEALSFALFRLSDFELALKAFKRFLDSPVDTTRKEWRNPRYIASRLRSFCWMLATSPDDVLRDGESALRGALLACEIYEQPSTLYLQTLAAAYAESGDYEKAIETIRKAIDDFESSRGSANRIELSEMLQSNLALFESGMPIRQTQ